MFRWHLSRRVCVYCGKWPVGRCVSGPHTDCSSAQLLSGHCTVHRSLGTAAISPYWKWNQRIFTVCKSKKIHSKIIWSRGQLNPCLYHSTRVMRTHHYFSDWSNVYFNGLIITHTSHFARKLNDIEHEPDPPVVKYWKAATAHHDEKIVLVFILAELAT